MPEILPGLVLAEAAPAAPAEGEAPGGGFTSFLPIVLIAVIFYFVLLRPSSRDRKKREALVKSVKKHDRVVTTAGIHGEVVALAETTVTLRVDDGVRLTFDRSAIWQVKPREGDGGTAGASADDDDAPATEKAVAEKGPNGRSREKGKA